MRPCAGPPRPHHLVRGLGGVVSTWGFPWVQSRARSAHLSRRRRESRRSGALDGLVRRRGSAPCAHHARIRLRDGRGCWWARQHASQRAHIAHRARLGQGEVPDHTLGAACRRQRALVGSALRRRRAACWRFVGQSSGCASGLGASRGRIGGCYVHAEGSRATSQGCGEVARHARITQRRHVGELEPESVLSRRGRRVSGIGQKKEKSTTCEPSTLRRSAWSRPTRGQRSARTSLPRRARTARWKGAGSVYVVSKRKLSRSRETSLGQHSALPDSRRPCTARP